MENSSQILYTGQPLRGGELLTIHRAGRTESDAMHREYHGSGDGYRIEYMLQGTGYVRTEEDGRMFQVSKGQLLCIRQGTAATLWTDREKHSIRIWFLLEGTGVDALFSLFRIPDVYTASSPALPECMALCDLLATGADNAEACAGVFALLAAILTRTMAPVVFPENRENDSVSRRMQVYIDSHLYENLHLDALASRFGYAKMHLIRLFREECGITPIQYVLQKRMEAACKLLTGTVMPVGEIAVLLQYSSAQHFAAAFRKHTGVTPSDYRKRGQAEM